MPNWSPYQLAIFADVARGTGHTVVDAVAGSGKTSTIEAAVDHVPPGYSTLFVAFNKPIADELARRLAGKPVTVSTLHSYGLKTVTSGLGRLRIHKYRVDDLIRAKYGDDPQSMPWRRNLAKAVSVAKGVLASTAEEVDAMLDAFSIEVPSRVPDELDAVAETGQGDDDRDPRDVFVDDVVRLLARCRDTSDGCLDFDDMVWLPVVLNLRQRQFARVFVDERQDLNAAQVEMVLRAVCKGGRICAVGDVRQAVYGFRGADSQAFERAAERLQAKVLPLSISYRCARAVIAEVRRVLPDIPIEAAPDAPAGEVAYVPRARMEAEVRPGDFILSRTNAPLVRLCMQFLREGRRANIQGRDVGESLCAFVRKSGARTVEALRDYVEEWAGKECARLAAKRRDTQAVEDRAACLLELSDGARSVDAVVDRIEQLFSDKGDETVIVLSSTHKAKGLERDRVWMLVGTYLRRPDTEETNLYYVACTRARRSLMLVEGFEKKKRRWDDGPREALTESAAHDEALS